jgi:hypothetical protein
MKRGEYIMNKHDLAKALRNGMFATRVDIDEAWKYVDLVARGSDNPAAVYTCVQVMVNTIAAAIIKTEEVTA